MYEQPLTIFFWGVKVDHFEPYFSSSLYIVGFYQGGFSGLEDVIFFLKLWGLIWSTYSNVCVDLLGSPSSSCLRDRVKLSGAVRSGRYLKSTWWTWGILKNLYHFSTCCIIKICCIGWNNCFSWFVMSVGLGELIQLRYMHICTVHSATSRIHYSCCSCSVTEKTG